MPQIKKKQHGVSNFAPTRGVGNRVKWKGILLDEVSVLETHYRHCEGNVFSI